MGDSPESVPTETTPNALTFSNLPAPDSKTGDRGARPEPTDDARQWYAVVVRNNNERSAAQQLEGLGFKTFVPMRTQVYRSGNKRTKRELVVVRTIIFARLAPNEALTLDRHSFVLKVLKTPGSMRPTPIPEHELEAFKFMLELSDDSFEFRQERVKQGDHVRVTRGKLKGLTGLVTRTDGSRGVFSVNIGFIGAASVSIPLTYLRTIKAAEA